MSARTTGRVALVGYGFGGSVFHAPFITAEPRLDLACVVTANSERRRQAAVRYPGVTVLSSLDGLLAQIPDIDLVVVSTPNGTHVKLVEEVLRRSRPVVVDKPVAPTADEVRHLAELAAAEGTVVVPFHNRGWDGDFRTVMALLRGGELGTLHVFESRYERWQPQVPSDADRGWKRDPAPSSATGIVHDLGTILSIRRLCCSAGPTRCTRRLHAVVRAVSGRFRNPGRRVGTLPPAPVTALAVVQARQEYACRSMPPHVVPSPTHSLPPPPLRGPGRSRL